MEPNFDSVFVEETEELVDRIGAELFSVLTLLVSGEFLTETDGKRGANYSTDTAPKLQQES